MHIGYFLGGMACLLYSAMCFWIGIKRPENTFKLVKIKLGGKLSDKSASIACFVFAGIALVGAILLFIFGNLKA